MTARPTRRRGMRLHTRLAVVIALAFALAGAGLVLTQNVLVNRLLTSSVDQAVVSSTGVVTGPAEQGPVTVCSAVPGGAYGCTQGSTVLPYDDVFGNPLGPGTTHGSIDSSITPYPDGRDTGDPVGTGDPTDGHLSEILVSSDMVASITFSQAHLAESVTADLAAWSVPTIVGFALLAALLAWLICRRSLARLHRMTTDIGEITHDRLDRRLHLTGRRDEITDLGDSFDEMLDRLTESFAVQRRFVANASHELRTPLATARTSLEVPLTQGRVPADLEPAIRRAIAANERSSRLLDSLLLLARLQDDQATRAAMTERIDEVPLAPVCERVLGNVTEEIAARELDVRVEVPPVRVLAAPDMLEQMCQNLLDNAVRHNRPGGTVRLTVHETADLVELVVTNDGDVLDPAQVPALLEAFHRGPRTRLAGADAGSGSTPGRGQGLGLTLVDHMVRLNRGRLDLAARPEGGLVVRLELPRATGAAKVPDTPA